jgi:hypothetical protein
MACKIDSGVAGSEPSDALDEAAFDPAMSADVYGENDRAFSDLAHNESATELSLRVLAPSPMPNGVAPLAQTAGNYCSLSDSCAFRGRVFSGCSVRPLPAPQGSPSSKNLALSTC